jgi:hypothetical protein
VIETARILRQMYAEILIVPLTVLKSSSAETLAAGLATVDPTLRRFRLVASESTLRARILQLGGATVTLDGRRRGSTPLMLPVAQGSTRWRRIILTRSTNSARSALRRYDHQPAPTDSDAAQASASSSSSSSAPFDSLGPPWLQPNANRTSLHRPCIGAVSAHQPPSLTSITI